MSPMKILLLNIILIILKLLVSKYPSTHLKYFKISKILRNFFPTCFKNFQPRLIMNFPKLSYYLNIPQTQNHHTKLPKYNSNPHFQLKAQISS